MKASISIKAPLYTLLIVTVAMLSACSGTRERYAYLGDAPRGEAFPISTQYSQNIAVGDQLYISVYSGEPATAYPYNQETNRIVTTSQVPGYLVGDNGTIIFPSLGSIAAAGITHDSLASYIEQRLRNDGLLLDPVVSVSPINYHITVVGEVKEPQMIPIIGSRITIFEALAQCGDITMTGIRSNIKVIRDSEHGKLVDSIDITTRSALQSPYYYLQNGDIVYVEPTPKRKREAYRNEDWPHYINSGTSILRFAYNTVYRYIILEPKLEKLRAEQQSK